ncbi:Pectate lyase [Rhynchospora pubera]|uniref:Pectate lyase n=1 Tax=Rhynchospora pubera TaxID=906938 RepID=A0AAV8CRF9_9POAL|nr:Pectate lyase [Rhynchospora pubera]
MECPNCSNVLSFLICSFLPFLLTGVASADLTNYEEYWKHQEVISRARNLAAYDPDPEVATDHFNRAVHEALPNNSTRRALGEWRGHAWASKCTATNPIDRCWRCRKNWTRERKRLVKCVKGFGHRTTGGAAGRYYVVTDPSDNNLVEPKPGTLRHAVVQDEPLWIVFARSMVITLREELIVNSHKTIDGRGASVHIAYGAQITIQNVHNIIIHNVKIHNITNSWGGMIRDSLSHFGLRTASDGDGISILSSSNIWIDHVSMWNCKDGLIDVIQGSTAITISNSHFTRHDHVMLFGASNSYEDDKIMQITVAFNHFGKGLVQRMPRCRFGFFHVVNNDYTHWEMYAIGGNMNPTIISQGNRYIAPPNIFAKEVTKREYTLESEWQNWVWKSEGDLMNNGASFIQSGGRTEKRYGRKNFIKAKSGTYVRRLTRFAGALNCKRNQKC